MALRREHIGKNVRDEVVDRHQRRLYRAAWQNVTSMRSYTVAESADATGYAVYTKSMKIQQSQLKKFTA